MVSIPPGPFLANRAEIIIAGDWWKERYRAWIAMGICDGPKQVINDHAAETPTKPVGALNGSGATLLAGTVLPRPTPRPAQPPGFLAPASPVTPDLLAGVMETIPYEDPFLAYHAERLAKAGENCLTFDEALWDYSIKDVVGIDVESFANFFVICFKKFSDGKRLAFERSDRTDFYVATVESVLQNNTIISFNGNHYDLPMVYLALSGASASELKEASNKIIFGNIKPWEVERELGVRVPRSLDHIDLMEPNPSIRQGLKILQGRLHCRFLIDLPFPHDAHLTPEQQNIATLYCHNDLDATEALYKALRDPLELRTAMGEIFGMDLRSKSDAQIGEAIVKQQAETLSKKRIPNDISDVPTSFGYEPPPFLKFQGQLLNDIFNKLIETRFHVMGKETELPEFLKELKIPIGDMKYSMGIGGLHSTEAHRALLSNEDHFLMDVDVASQYPNIILKLGLYPKSIGPDFLQIYKTLVDERLAAKASGDTVRSEGGKIIILGCSGKLRSSYSFLFSPDLFVAMTLTGQLATLMLIERAENAGIRVVSANTDGIVFYCHRMLETELDLIIADWEQQTGFSVGRTRYNALYNSSVNTYIGIGEDGKVKRKGAIANPWAEGDLREQMKKNPQMTVCSDAIVSHLLNGTPVEESINSCHDPKAFVTVIKVSGGAIWRGHSLGRAVRYYWSTDGEEIRYAQAKRRVSKTEGARPLQELTDQLPKDIDYTRYHREAHRLAVDLGIRM